MKKVTEKSRNNLKKMKSSDPDIYVEDLDLDISGCCKVWTNSCTFKILNKKKVKRINFTFLEMEILTEMLKQFDEEEDEEEDLVPIGKNPKESYKDFCTAFFNDPSIV